MAIELPADEQIVIAAKPETRADKLWMTQLVIRTPGPTDANSLVLEYQPWSGGAERPLARDGEMNDTTRSIVVDDLFRVAREVPEIAVAMQAILKAIPALVNYVKSDKPKD